MKMFLKHANFLKSLSLSTINCLRIIRPKATGVKSMESSPFRIISVAECPGLLRTFLCADMSFRPDHPFAGSWPHFMGMSPVFQNCVPVLWKDPTLCRWQFLVVANVQEAAGVTSPSQQNGEVIAFGSSIPFYWATLEDPTSLPDGGWEEVLKTAVDRHLSHDTCQPNALCCLEMTINMEYRNKAVGFDIPNEIFSKMKRAAVEAGLKAVTLPVRPTRKSHGTNVWMKMERYCSLTKGKENEKQLENEAEDALIPWPEGTEPYDPWIRKHLRLGSQMVKVCHTSYIVEGTLSEWEEWTGVDFSVPSVNPLKPVEGSTSSDQKDFYEVVVPGALVPVKVYPAKGLGLYVEPNVWFVHKVHTTGN